jgi:hypothetical protein
VAEQVWNPRPPLLKSHLFRGRLAQLGERIVRNDEAGGSIPPPSTNFLRHTLCWRPKCQRQQRFRFRMRIKLHCWPAYRVFYSLPLLALLLSSGCGKLRSWYGQKENPHSVTIAWTATNPPVAGYNVYRASPPGSPVKLTLRLVPGTQYTDTTVEAGHTYVYSVTSVDFSGVEGNPSANTTVTVPATVTPPAKQ